MKIDALDKLILNGLTLYYLSPLRGKEGYGKVAMLMKAGLDYNLAKAPMTLVTFDNVYGRMVQDSGYPLPPWHAYFRDNDFRDSLVMQFNEIVVDTGVAEMMRMAGYQQEEISFSKLDADGNKICVQTKNYKRLYNRIKYLRKITEHLKACPDNVPSAEALPDKTGSSIKILGEASNNKNVVPKKHGSGTKQTNGHGIMSLDDISKALMEVSQPNREKVLKKVLTSMSASEKENLKAFMK